MATPTDTAPKPRSRLSREQVARAALEFLDRYGLEQLSMRRLAAELGVGTMTLYGYYGSKQELLNGVADAAMGDVSPPLGDGPWPERLRELMRWARSRIGAHPALVKLRASQPILQPESLRVCEAALTILGEAGFERREAALAFRLLFTYAFGYVTFSPDEGAAEAERLSKAASARLPAEEYPRLTAAAEELAATMAGEEAFEFGLERIIAGLEAQLQASGRGSGAPGAGEPAGGT